MRIYDKIKQKIEITPGLTQRGLAEAMGLDPAAVNRMIYGRRKISAEEMPLIESYLGISLTHQESVSMQTPPRGFSDTVQSVLSPALPQIPVYAFEQGTRRLVDWADRHPQQAGIQDAFAVYVDDSRMEPRYFPGELVYLHPGRPVQPGRDALIDHGDAAPYLCRIHGVTADDFTVAVFKPAEQKDIPRNSVRFAYSVIGRG